MEETFRRVAEQIYSEWASFDDSKNDRLPRAIKYLPKEIFQMDSNGNWDPLVFREGIGVLNNFSLVCRDKGQETYSIHPLVHYWSRDRMKQAEQSEICQSVHAILSSSIAVVHGQPGHDFQHCRRMLPHINSLQQHIAEASLPEKYYDDAFAKYWHVYNENGYITDAMRFASQVKENRTRVLGEKHQSTLIAAASLATTLRESGEKGALERVKAIHENTHIRRIETLGESHLETLDSMNELGSIYIHSREFKKAEEFLSQARRGRKDQLGEKNPATLQTETQLSGAYRALDKDDEAEKLQRKTLDNA
jgi:hypothetical protein